MFTDGTDVERNVYFGDRTLLNLASASSWAHAYLMEAVRLGLVPSNLMSNFTSATTRAEFAHLAVTFYELWTGREIVPCTSISFVDTNDINVRKAAMIDVTWGVGDNRFDPDSQLTREQAATMLSRLAVAAAPDRPLPQFETAFDNIGLPYWASFADNAAVSYWAAFSVGQMQKSGIMGGIGNNMFSPQGSYTREQSITTILRLRNFLEGIQPLGGTPVTTPPPTQQPPTPSTPQPPTATSVSVGDIIQFGGYQWRVLEVQGGRALIITEHVIAERQYHHADVPVTWETSDIRRWLNNDFINRFSESDRARIIQTTVINNDNLWFGTHGGNDTVDRIFLLSIDEVLRYFGDSGLVARGVAMSMDERDSAGDSFWWGGISDRYNNARIARNLDGSPSREWWLRSPGSRPGVAAVVFSGCGDSRLCGALNLGGYVPWRQDGVRPALWLNLES